MELAGSSRTWRKNQRRTTTNSESVLRYIDWFTVVLYLLLVSAGVASIYAASYDFDHANIFSFCEFSGKQVTWIGLSLVIGLVILITDSRIFETYAYPIYLALLMLLVVTIFVAPDIKGSRSWLVFGPMSLQPAEFAKFATALALAKLFTTYNFNLNATPRNYFKALLIIFTPIILILAQKETGSSLVYLSLFFVLYREGMSGLILFAALWAVVIFVVTIKYTTSMIIGIPTGEFAVLTMTMLLLVGMLALYVRRFEVSRNVFLWFVGTAVIEAILSIWDVNLPGYIFFGIVIGGALIYCLFEMLRIKAQKLMLTVLTVALSVGFMFSVNLVFSNMMPHQQKRINVALGIEDDPRGDGYNVNQSKIAIGSGGFTGKGFIKGTQTKLKYVPEQHTDFIFCTIGEEEGFLGTTAVIILFLTLILRIISLAERQPTVFGRVYAYCVASYFIFHFCINIGMVIGLCPVIGIPLPFFSYGGSSLWGFTILLFILLRIDAARRFHLH
jgi:rod shape determining protein RodA